MSFWPIYIIVFLMAALPAGIWLYLFLRQHKENRWVVLLVFMAGMLAAKLILVYQGYWDTTVNLIFAKITFVDFRSNLGGLIVSGFFSALAVFVGVGVLEEISKFWMMKVVGRRFFKSIDDVIILAIVSALGFAFFENMVYFSSQWGLLNGWNFAVFALSRVTIVTMVHVLCSGVLGYYFGMAFFADPILAIDHARKKRHPILDFFHRALHLKQSVIYHDEMIMKGLLLAIGLHALYNFILFPEFTLPSWALISMMLVYFFGGYRFLIHLIRKKETQLELGVVQEEAISTPRLEKLMEEVKLIKEIRSLDLVTEALEIDEGRKSRKESRFRKN